MLLQGSSTVIVVPAAVLFLCLLFQMEKRNPNEERCIQGKVPRSNWFPKKNADIKLCEKHFHESDRRTHSVDK